MATTITGNTIDVGPNKLVADSAGNVGINTATPRALLDLGAGSGDGSLSNTTSQYQVVLAAPTGTGDYGRNIGWVEANSNIVAAINAVDNGTSSSTGLTFSTGNTSAIAEAMRIDDDGIVTKPLQPAFLVGSSGITNLAVNAYVTVPWNVSEIFDIGSNFASNRFTAPVTGKYQLAVSLRVENLDSASQYYILQFTTSNRTYRIIFDPDFGQDNGFWDFGLSTLADMDAGDTATVEIHQASGTAQTDINASANWSFFSGYLVC